MRILFTFPFCAPSVNSISGGPIYLGSQGHDVLVITSQMSDSLKGKVNAPAFEELGRTKFYRPYLSSKDLTWRPDTCWLDVKRTVAAFKPEVVIGFGDAFFRLPLQLSRHFQLPLVMFFEYLRPEKFSLPIRGSGKIRKYSPGIYRICSKQFRRYLAQRCAAIMFSYYGDIPFAMGIKKECKNIYYIPWCTETENNLSQVRRNKKVGVYMGSLDAFKNAAELVLAIPLIMKQTAVEKFIVLGPGDYAPQIKQLVMQYGPRVEYIESLPRPEAMRLLSSAGFGYTPVTDCGLGFIGDCWGSGTPLITTHKLEGFLENDDTLIAEDVYELPSMINTLLDSDTLYERMQQGGIRRYDTNHTARAVGEKYLEVLHAII